MFFEGSEKKVEMVVSGVDLRDLGRSYWSDVVRQCQGEILSQMSNDDLDAYLLSESSLFVWTHRMVMITCGETVLLHSVLKLIKDLGIDHIESLIFQRKNEYDHSRQKSSFVEDVKRIRETVEGQAYRFGHLDGHHHFVFNMNKPYRSKTEDRTAELLMYHINGKASDTFLHENQDREKMRNILNVNALEGFMVDDYLFKPCGYSLNAIKGDKYVTIHVTPYGDFSYVSYETTLDVAGEYAPLLPKLVSSLSPESFDLVTFDVKVSGFDKNYFKWDDVRKNLSCGYHTQFSHYVSLRCDARDPQPLFE